MSMALLGLIGGFGGLTDHLSDKHDNYCSLTFHIIMITIGVVGFIFYGYTYSKLDNSKTKK